MRRFAGLGAIAGATVGAAAAARAAVAQAGVLGAPGTNIFGGFVTNAARKMGRSDQGRSFFAGAGLGLAAGRAGGWRTIMSRQRCASLSMTLNSAS
ncbi:MAG: hypothetical protein FJW32_24420, partial [Acidobacteria bacterium]|nr:hypothetical protein [Acidobacteriota bacterium]